MSTLKSEAKTLRELQLVAGFDKQFDKEKLIKEGATGLAEILENKYVSLEEAQKEIEKWRQQQKDDYATYQDKVQKLEEKCQEYSKLLVATLHEAKEYENKMESKIAEANKILDLADFEALTGAHKIHWSNWQALCEALKQ